MRHFQQNVIILTSPCVGRSCITAGELGLDWAGCFHTDLHPCCVLWLVTVYHVAGMFLCLCSVKYSLGELRELLYHGAFWKSRKPQYPSRIAGPVLSPCLPGTLPVENDCSPVFKKAPLKWKWEEASIKVWGFARSRGLSTLSFTTRMYCILVLDFL